MISARLAYDLGEVRLMISARPTDDGGHFPDRHGKTRALALDARFMARGALPYVAVAAHILHNGQPPELPAGAGGHIAAPLPLATGATGLPVDTLPLWVSAFGGWSLWRCALLALVDKA